MKKEFKKPLVEVVKIESVLMVDVSTSPEEANGMAKSFSGNTSWHIGE